MGKWDINHYTSVELFMDDGVVYDSSDETNDTIQKLAPVLSKVPDQYGELVLHFRSQGYHEPMSMYGGPDNLGWPEEYDDERTLLQAVLEAGGKKIEIPAPLNEELFQQYINEVNEEELPDYDDYYEDVNKLANAITEDPDIPGGVPERPVEANQGFAIKFRGKLLECSDEDGRDMICLYKTEEDANESAMRSDLDDWELVRVVIS